MLLNTTFDYDTKCVVVLLVLLVLIEALLLLVVRSKLRRGCFLFVSYDGGEEKRTKDMYVYDDG